MPLDPEDDALELPAWLDQRPNPVAAEAPAAPKRKRRKRRRKAGALAKGQLRRGGKTPPRDEAPTLAEAGIDKNLPTELGGADVARNATDDLVVAELGFTPTPLAERRPEPTITGPPVRERSWSGDDTRRLRCLVSLGHDARKIAFMLRRSTEMIRRKTAEHQLRYGAMDPSQAQRDLRRLEEL